MTVKVAEIKINTEYITLGQLLKKTGLITNGGEAKFFLTINEILVNGEPENRRGKKLRAGDEIIVNNNKGFLISDGT